MGRNRMKVNNIGINSFDSQDLKDYVHDGAGAVFARLPNQVCL